jgi:hypothetical protein
VTPTISLEFDSLRIYFGDTLHLHVKRSKLLGVQSWRYGENNYSIEYTMDGNNILTEYDDKEKFEAILRRLDEIL